jgi:hypothetical protein
MGVCVFLQVEEIFVSGEGTDAGCVGVGALRCSRLQRVCACHTEASAPVQQFHTMPLWSRIF